MWTLGLFQHYGQGLKTMWIHRVRDRERKRERGRGREKEREREREGAREL